MALEQWWAKVGSEVEIDDLASPAARALASALAGGSLPAATLLDTRQNPETGLCAVHMEVEVERPQDLAYLIRSVEPVVVVFADKLGHPHVLAVREGFPDTPHQNWVPEGWPNSLCIDDRPWAEAQLSWSAGGFIRQIQTWLAKASRGELHDTGRPMEPLFFGSSCSIVVPRESLKADPTVPLELAGFQPEDGDGRIILTEPLNGAGPRPHSGGRFVVLRFMTAPQVAANLRHAPTTLAELADAVQPLGLNLLEQLHAQLREWAGLKNDALRRLSANLAIIVGFPITAPDGGNASIDMRAFLVPEPVGEVGTDLGWLAPHVANAGGEQGYLPILGAGTPEKASEIVLFATDIHVAFDRELGAQVCNRPTSDRRHALLVGAGSIGSQLAMMLAREGYFQWSVVDNDRLLPHNLARHALTARYVGMAKATALARELSRLLREPCPSVVTDILFPSDDKKPALDALLAEAELIIDTSASVGVSRHLAHLPDLKGRRIAAFFNPAGTAGILLVESADRSVTLHDLEAQYHRLVQTEAGLRDHLAATHAGLRYSGSCRAATNRIPATNASLLSTLAARGLTAGIDDDAAFVQVWTLTPEGGVTVLRQPAAPVHRAEISTWQLVYDDGLLRKLSQLRDAHLPNETGGVLLGIVDRERQILHVVDALPQPEDSVASPGGFERGVEGLLETVNQTAERSMHQLQYVGEWHSHPRFSNADPSATDFKQLLWLGEQMAAEEMPIIMAIAGDKSDFRFVSITPAAAEGD